MINFELTEPEVISSYNLARKCDLVYSEILTLSQFKEIKEIDGFLIGGASKSPKKFIDIIKNYYR